MRVAILRKPSSCWRASSVDIPHYRNRAPRTSKMWLKICVLMLCSIYSTWSLEISPLKAVFSVANGSSLQVNCSSPNAVQWKSDPQDAMPPSGKTFTQGSVNPGSGDNISTLMLENVNKSNEATYKCIDTEKKDEISFQLRVFTVTSKGAEYIYKEDSMLHCSVDDDSKTFTYSWMKDAKPVSALKGDGDMEFVQHENGTLEIKHAPRGVAGLYVCVATYTENSEEHTIEIPVELYAAPKVKPFQKSKNLVQEERLTIECEVLGYPKPYVTWFKENIEIKAEKGSRYLLNPADTYNGAKVDDAKLEIEHVNFDDEGEYKCMARNSRWPEFNSTQTILVRVKDKLAALWPFLGIVAEVVILCTIIFIYEKKRNKDAVEDEDPNQDGATPEKKSEGVRHRGGANNPRA